ncbi:murein hydrolase activator EnvC family protein [Hydrogenimonas sp.]
MIFRKILPLLLVVILPLFSGSIDRKIKNSRQKLADIKHSYASMDRKLAATAKKIAANQKKLEELDRAIAKYEKEIAVNSVLLKEGERRLAEIEKQKKLLDSTKRKQEKRLVDLLANRFIFEEIEKEKGIQSPEDVIEAEILSALVRSDSKALKEMQASYLRTVRENEKLVREAERIRKMIARLKRRKEEAAKEKMERKKLIASLEREKKAYQKRLEKLQKEEGELGRMLSRLHILKKKEIEKAKRKKSSNNATLARGDKLKVRTIGSSYQRNAVGHYRGKKTISPVGRAKVVKKFGSYIDPIYKIRIFNESVTLQPSRKNAKVKNVLNGRVVFAKETPMLGKVVIVEHGNNLHTIYAKMKKIAPTIKEGKKIKKGYVIGRIDRELMFEVTQRNRHINPLELIRLR